DKVMLKVSPWKGVVRFGKRGKLNPRYVGPFKVLKKKKCYYNDPLAVPLEGLHVDDKLYFVEEPVEIMDHKVKQLRRSRVPIIKVKQKEDGIFISQDKYVAEILKKFDFMSVKTACTPIETHKPLVKDEEAADVDVHLYRFQVTPKTSHLHAVKRIFRYLKGKPKLGLWYPRESSFDLVAYSDSDYGGANLDRKSTTGGCQFLGHRLISWQCKKQTIVATSTTEAEYVAAANCCGQVLWIQNQMLDYGFNFMNTRIYIDNESTICIVKNLVFHSKTKHIKIRHHFIRDAYEKKLIQVLKIHTDDNVADLLTKAFDVSRSLVLLVQKFILLDSVNTAEYILFLDANLRKGNYWKHGCSLSVGFNHHTTNGHQFTMSNKHQELASPEQTTSGKDFSNPLIVDSLLKTIWLSMHHSNDPPLSRGYTLRSGEDSLKLMELMEFVQNYVTTFNFLKLIFDAMVKNLDNPHKFFMYPKFIQICLNKQRRLLQPHTRTYPTPVLTQKVFSNMKRVTRGYSGEDIPLFPSMITASETSPSRITSSPSLSPQHTPVSAPSTSPPPITETTPTVEEPALMPNESPLQSVQSLRRDEGSVSLNELMDLVTQLTNKVRSFENELTNNKKVYGSAITMLVKRVKKLEKQVKTSKARRRTKIVLSEYEGLKRSIELIEEPTELVEDQGSGEKGEQEVTTGDTALNIASVPISNWLVATLRKEAVTEVDTAHVIDWNDPSVIRYHALQNRPRSVAEVRKNMMVYLKNQGGYKMKDFKGMSYDDIGPIFEKIMAASAIAISFDSSNESVGSPPSWVILFGDIPTVIPSTSVVALEISTIAPVISSAAPVVETTLVASPTGLSISPFLCTDSSEAPGSSDGPPSQDPYVATVARWKSRATARPSSSSEFPIAPVTAPPGIRRRKRIGPLPDHRLAWRHASPRSSDHRSSSSCSSSDSSPVHFSGLDASDQAHSGSSTRDVPPRLCYPSRRAPRRSEAFCRWCAAPLSTLYPPTTSKSSSGDLSERPLHSSSHSAGPSRKRCRAPIDSIPSSTPVIGSLAPTRADLLPPRKRFRDSYSSEASIEEDTKIDPIETEVDMKLGIGDGDEVRDHVEIDPRDVRDDIEEYEGDTSAGDTVEVGIDPMSAPIVEEEIVEPAGEDPSNSSGTKDGIVRSFKDMLIDLSDDARDFYHHMSEVRIDRIVGIKIVQR
ncbi:hypothetical protein Tco_0982047, partial [Tanacetum coccineum]